MGFNQQTWEWNQPFNEDIMDAELEYMVIYLEYAGVYSKVVPHI